MRVVFMGTPDFSVPALDAIAQEHEVICVYSQPPRPAGRGKKLRPSPVHARADALGIETRTPLNFKDPEDVAAFNALKADIAVVVAYGLLLPQSILDAPKLGCVNIHASLLPRWRGAAPIHRAIMAGDRETGICIMQMEAGLDTGPVLLREAIPIAPDDTTGSLHDELAHMGGRMIASALAEFNALSPESQSTQGVTYAKKIDKAESKIDWGQSAAQVDAHIRGLSPFPGAWFEQDGERIKVLRSALSIGEGVAGTIRRDPLRVCCKSGAVSLLTLQRAGKGAMEAEDFLRGFDLPDGCKLGS